MDSTITAPPLPERSWHRMTEVWWADLWSSPMAPEFDASDKHGLFTLALLVDDSWTTDDSGPMRAKIALEIRQQSQRFGLSPVDRRRLQWVPE